MDLLFGSLVIFTAYFLKGFSGFGPALVIIPFFSFLYDPATAIAVAAVFDFISGCILTYSVRKEIQWNFVLPVFAALGAGALFGSLLLGIIPMEILKKIIGVVIIIFAVIILFQKNGLQGTKRSAVKNLKYPVSFLGGFLGGFIGISGPPIIIYMKMMYDKKFFRNQLIGVFLLGAGWRSVLYYLNGIRMDLTLFSILLFLIVTLLALWTGNHFHSKANETVFNKVVAGLLFIPSINLIFGS